MPHPLSLCLIIFASHCLSFYAAALIFVVLCGLDRLSELRVRRKAWMWKGVSRSDGKARTHLLWSTQTMSRHDQVSVYTCMYICI